MPLTSADRERFAEAHHDSAWHLETDLEKLCVSADVESVPEVDESGVWHETRVALVLRVEGYDVRADLREALERMLEVL